jgi:hypothetical protein
MASKKQASERKLMELSADMAQCSGCSTEIKKSLECTIEQTQLFWLTAIASQMHSTL